MPHASPPAAGETIGQRLKRLRLERGLSQRELAAPGVSYAYISRIEAGTRQPSVKALRRLAAKLGVTAGYLETGSDLDPAEARELRLADLELAVRLGETKDAEAPLLEVLDDCISAGDQRGALRARVVLAAVALELGRHERAITLLEAALAGEPFCPVDRYQIYANLGRAYAGVGRTQEAIALYERCLEAVTEPTAEARYATLLSYALTDAGDLARAEEVVRHALERVRNAEDPYMRVRLHWSVARLAHAEGTEGAALTSARKAIALLETTEDTVNLARAHLLAAAIMIARADADGAAEHLDSAERLLAGASSFTESVMLRVKRAQVGALRQDGAEAARLAHEALEMLGDALPAEQGAAYWALADGLALLADNEAADDAYRRSVTILEEQHRWREATQACRAWARMLRTTGREQQALDVLDRAAELGMRTAPADSLPER